MKERLIELIDKKQAGGWRYVVDDYTTDVFNEDIADYLLDNGVIALPCAVGDYVEYDHGHCKSLYQVRGFLFDELGVCFDIGLLLPRDNDPNIKRILTKEEAEAELLKRSKENA